MSDNNVIFIKLNEAEANKLETFLTQCLAVVRPHINPSDPTHQESVDLYENILKQIEAKKNA